MYYPTFRTRLFCSQIFNIARNKSALAGIENFNKKQLDTFDGQRVININLKIQVEVSLLKLFISKKVGKNFSNITFKEENFQTRPSMNKSQGI